MSNAVHHATYSESFPRNLFGCLLGDIFTFLIGEFLRTQTFHLLGMYSLSNTIFFIIDFEYQVLPIEKLFTVNTD